MWNRVLPLFLLLASISAHAEEDWHPETVSYEVKEKTRFYRWSKYDKSKKQQIYISFVLPAGVTLEGCGRVGEGFLEGKDCAQADDALVAGILQKDGKKRRIVIALGGGAYDSEKRPDITTRDGRLKAVRRILSRPNSSEENLNSGDFKVQENEGFFVEKKIPSPDGYHEYYKIISRIQMPCALSGYYREMETDQTKLKYFASDERLFEGVFDEIMRSMRCEEVSWDYVEKWNKEQEVKTTKAVSKKSNSKKKIKK